MELNATHDPQRRSWVASANRADADFPIQNLPFAVFRRIGTDDAPRCGVGIGDQILDVTLCSELFAKPVAVAARACETDSLNRLMALDPSIISTFRHQLSELLEANHAEHRSAVEQALVPIQSVELLLPVRIGGFTDFFASVHHATNAGKLFRPDNPLLPNYKYVPVAYNGRANSVRASGGLLRRPRGQIRVPGQDVPSYLPARRVDYEVELGLYIGQATTPDQPVPVSDAWRHVFGFSLLNDWSARDIQAWEYQPLGPFLAKSFATTVAPWVVTAEALLPFRTAAATRAAGDPLPLPHLSDEVDQRFGALDIEIEARLLTDSMARTGQPSLPLSSSNAATLYWTSAQMIAHHTSNGSSLDTGDLLGSGTISGPTRDAFGSLLEITGGGAEPFQIRGTDEHRTFLEDGDEIRLRAKCRRDGFVSLGFGECAARLLLAHG
ncbi:fumarylacetoacetase [Burkholderia multivorans]|uniref:fumarylacetoacetase n=1 Tax=Burkholderia multivorans TaxID=87883 RepID=UPI001C2722F6|nr:fumarylacetoacetase [Burkholderia multivorans]MBU9598258.1 fumarylacetoacetase [Burkholderia multivorans]MDN7997004.1 fumarylacetoacetase [Burkholderia multivorans]